MSAEDKKPREWNLQIRNGKVMHAMEGLQIGKDIERVHVIEYSAYEAERQSAEVNCENAKVFAERLETATHKIARLEAERDEAVNRYANEVSRIPKLNQHIDLLREQRDSLKAELEQAKQEINRIDQIGGKAVAQNILLKLHADKLAGFIDKTCGRFEDGEDVEEAIALLAEHERMKK